MVKHFDHVTIVVTDVDRAKRFFALLGFQEAMSVVISGEEFAHYMRVGGIEAEHHTLVLTNSVPRLEVQLLKYRHPDALPNPQLATLREVRSEEHTSELQSRENLVCRLLLEKKKTNKIQIEPGQKKNKKKKNK